ncbi:MAG: GAF domain-containing protein [Myxococcota bacterium]|nr:GAF domain-containing protein [Myxococcota bacterium]
MGSALNAVFDEAGKLGGIQAKMKLAGIAKMTSTQATSITDTPELVRTFRKALKTERTIAAHDAHVDPRTSWFSTVYLKPLNINSMLDVPIMVNEKMVGVVCHEQVGPARSWNADEEKFAYLMASLVALALERRIERQGKGGA